MRIPHLVVALGLACLLPPACSKQAGGSSGEGGRPPEAAQDGLPERPVPGRVFLVGIDGASWDVFDFVLADGVMPRLAELCARGTKAELRSMSPTASAILWTTIATGKLPKKHGILGFVAETEAGQTVPVSSTMREVEAVWNIAGRAGVSVGFLAWWVSWPAEPVRGFMITDYAWPLRKDERGFATGTDPAIDREDRTWPRELMAELEPLNLTEARLSSERLDELKISAIPPVRGYAIRDIFLKDVSIDAMTRHMVEKGNGESLIATYFDGYDAFCHVFWPAYRAYSAARRQGEAALAGLDPSWRALGEAMDAHLARIDASLGFLMDEARPEDTVMVISDHGFFDNPGRKPIERTYGDFLEGQAFWHTERGIIAAMGGPIRRGATDLGATVLDVTPTLLALLGLPVGEDMDGHVLRGLFTDEFLRDHPVTTIPTHETGRRRSTATESPYDAAMLERLEQLGYLGD
ncbi:MAG: alkaline phosphatase family protein [Planctomycetota bacterium]|jgi:predicted AlkP superfamily pyrophosphatase or phosphodiesterase|nr:alkaline phosphatase family protein [Planctomycetota bacterium]MDP6988416.1 alkaline phosphatase family protein [Planctomycetota bacterium]